MHRSSSLEIERVDNASREFSVILNLLFTQPLLQKQEKEVVGRCEVGIIWCLVTHVVVKEDYDLSLVSISQFTSAVINDHVQ